ncbi:ATP-dependent Clp protease ATP-binding subunit [Candidatus Uhrbacteria bacterium]|nr:ATP-dependent Clp protease ATP-binding subunit [Candidatus Uhrbacteria bacterium]
MDERKGTESMSEREALAELTIVEASPEHPFDFGALFDGMFYVWDVRVDPWSRRIDRAANQWARWFSGVIALVAVLLLIWFFVNVFVFFPSGTFFSANFWMQPSPAQLPLWLSAGLCLLLIFRRARAMREPRETGTHLERTVMNESVSWDEARAKASRDCVRVAAHVSNDVWETIDDASYFAERAGHTSIGLLHLFSGTLSRARVGHVFARLGLTFEHVKEPLIKKMQGYHAVATATSVLAFDAEAQKLMMGAMMHALMHGRTVASSVDVFVCAYRYSPFLREVFYEAGVEEEHMENVLEWLMIRERMRARYEAFRRSSALKPVTNMNRAMTAVATPFLDRVSHDLTVAAVRGGLDFLVGREEEMERILRVFESGGRSVVLVGHHGVGKMALVNGLAERMVSERVPPMLQDRRLVELDVGRLLAGATPAQAEERLLLALQEIARSKNIALVVPDIDNIVGVSSGGGQSLDLSSLLAAEIEKGYFVSVATSTPDAYASAVEGSMLGSVLTKVDIDEPQKRDAIRIVLTKAIVPESQHRVLFSYAAIEAIVGMTARYVHDQYLPEKALRVLDEVALYAKQQRGTGAVVLREDVAHIVSGITKIPLNAVTSDEREKLLHLEERMKTRMVGQEEAVHMVASALRRARAELRSGKRPIATFLFLGPTGVGKTELAKTIAESYFGNEQAMIRLDMSEYQDTTSLHRLIGVPGSGRGGLFTEAVRKQPFALVLLDELEKAHPDILNVFLQVFDDGRLTDAVGRTVDFTEIRILLKRSLLNPIGQNF